MGVRRSWENVGLAGDAAGGQRGSRGLVAGRVLARLVRGGICWQGGAAIVGGGGVEAESCCEGALLAPPALAPSTARSRWRGAWGGRCTGQGCGPNGARVHMARVLGML